MGFAFVVLLICSCKDNNVRNLSEKAIGKWIAVERNDAPLLTNMSHVLTFESPKEAYTTTSWIELIERDDNPSLSKRGNSEVVIKGRKIIKTIRVNPHITVIDEMKVTSITENDMYGISEVKTYIDGAKVMTTKYTARYTKVTANYEQAILGLWEGQVISEMGTDFGDSERHRWEFLPDGNYRFYNWDDGQWKENDEFAQYVIDGTMICCRWKNLGESQDEHREWWVISSCENGVMEWSAIRERPDAATYTSTVKMTKVN